MMDNEQGRGALRPRCMRPLGIVVCLLVTLTLALPALALDVGARLPEIGLKDLNGQRVDLASLKGKVVIVDFLASWCGPCKEEMPVLERLYKRYKASGLVVVGVSVDKDLENLRGLLKKVKVSFPVVHDATQDVAGRYRPARMPSSYVIDRKGIVRHVHAGFRAEDAEKLEREVSALLAAK